MSAIIENEKKNVQKTSSCSEPLAYVSLGKACLFFGPWVYPEGAHQVASKALPTLSSYSTWHLIPPMLNHRDSSGDKLWQQELIRLFHCAYIID